jgi:biotin-dependent carboxylase-like uncharacterized protein
MPTIEILATGALSTVQDRGRFGYLRLGVPISGAADRGSFRLANRLVGNDEGSAAIECLLGGIALSADAPIIVAVTGAPAQAFIDATPVGHASVLRLAPGQILRLETADVGLRSYLAVRGGIIVDPVLGSASTDTLSGIGPDVLRPGAVLAIGSRSLDYPVLDVAPVATMSAGTLTLRASLGPRADWLRNPRDLATASWQVSSESDRVGVRLDRTSSSDPALRRAEAGELASEGIPLGGIQIPPSGQPVIFLADHPVTGGYPVIAVLRGRDVDLAAQARPGQCIRFVLI